MSSMGWALQGTSRRPTARLKGTSPAFVASGYSLSSRHSRLTEALSFVPSLRDTSHLRLVIPPLHNQSKQGATSRAAAGAGALASLVGAISMTQAPFHTSVLLSGPGIRYRRETWVLVPTVLTLGRSLRPSISPPVKQR